MFLFQIIFAESSLCIIYGANSIISYNNKHEYILEYVNYIESINVRKLIIYYLLLNKIKLKYFKHLEIRINNFCNCSWLMDFKIYYKLDY